VGDHGTAFEARVTAPLLGRRLRIRSSHAAAGHYLAAIFGGERDRGSADPVLELRLAGDSRRSLGIWIDDTLAAAEVPVAEAPARALAAVNRWLCFAPGPLLTLHAAAAARGGAAVALVGDSGAGKSTLVAGLVRAGWIYLSDEAIGIDRHATIHPYARPITLRTGAWSEFPGMAGRLPAGHERFARSEWHIPPGLLGPAAEAPLPPRSIVFVSHVGDAVTELRPIARGEALEHMARQACNLNAFGQEGLERLAGVVQRSDCYRLLSGRLGDAVEALDALR
jgi:hypothetical protein